MQYRRANVPGACYFFTVNLAERNKSLLIDYVDDLRKARRLRSLAYRSQILHGMDDEGGEPIYVQARSLRLGRLPQKISYHYKQIR